MELVDAYLARRALDYLVGFTLSPVLWRKLPGSRSAGRVQSVALRLICRARSRDRGFKTQEYWTVEADVTAGADPFLARLTQLDGKRLDQVRPGQRADAKRAVASDQGAEASPSARREEAGPAQPAAALHHLDPAAGSLAQAGLLGAKRTMQAAQKLYEGVDIGGETVGLITYMRTDGVQHGPRRSPRPAR
jgi:DNA topoisomerase-1